MKVYLIYMVLKCTPNTINIPIRCMCHSYTIKEIKKQALERSELLGCSLLGQARVEGSGELRRRPECSSLARPGRGKVPVQERWAVSLVSSLSESKAVS